MNDCKYSDVCEFYGTPTCYVGNDEGKGCFRHKYFKINLKGNVLERLADNFQIEEEFNETFLRE